MRSPPHRAADRAGGHLPLGGFSAFARATGACRWPTAISASSRMARSRCVGSRPGAATPRLSSPRCRWRCWKSWPIHRPRRWRGGGAGAAALQAVAAAPGQVPLEDMLLSHKLGREPEEYKANSAAARAARQLQAAGVTVKPGQRLRFLYTLGRPGVWAWEQPENQPARASMSNAMRNWPGAPQRPSWGR